MKKFKKVYIEITNICNKHCSFCSDDERVKKQMTVDEFEHVIKNVKEYTKYIYLHVKGEPLLHKNLKEILELCTKYDIMVNITTNGTMLLKKLNILKEASCIRQINISLHSFENECAIDYIQDVMMATDELQRKTNIIVVYRFWALKNNQLSSENQFLMNEIIKNYHLDLELQRKIIQDVNIKIGKELYINKAPLFEWPSLDSDTVGVEGFCYGMSRHIGILVDGTVIPCCLDSKGIINLGNIFSTPLSDILHGKRAQTLLKSFRDNKVCEQLCQKCNYRLRFKRNMI